jgi:hypothetical protein
MASVSLSPLSAQCLSPNAAASNEAASQVTPELKINTRRTSPANLQYLRRSFDPLNWVLFDKDEILDYCTYAVEVTVAGNYLGIVRAASHNTAAYMQADNGQRTTDT